MENKKKNVNVYNEDKKITICSKICKEVAKTTDYSINGINGIEFGSNSGITMDITEKSDDNSSSSNKRK